MRILLGNPRPFSSNACPQIPSRTRVLSMVSSRYLCQFWPLYIRICLLQQTCCYQPHLPPQYDDNLNLQHTPFSTLLTHGASITPPFLCPPPTHTRKQTPRNLLLSSMPHSRTDIDAPVTTQAFPYYLSYLMKVLCEVIPISPNFKGVFSARKSAWHKQ
jgi:hypothetical protein